MKPMVVVNSQDFIFDLLYDDMYTYVNAARVS